MGVLLLAIGFVGVVFTLLYGGVTLLARAWTRRFGPSIPAGRLAPAAANGLVDDAEAAERLAPTVASSLVDEAEAWLRSYPPGPDPTTQAGT